MTTHPVQGSPKPPDELRARIEAQLAAVWSEFGDCYHGWSVTNCSNCGAKAVIHAVRAVLDQPTP